MDTRYIVRIMVGFTAILAATIYFLSVAGMQPYEGGCARYGTADEIACR